MAVSCLAFNSKYPSQDVSRRWSQSPDLQTQPPVTIPVHRGRPSVRTILIYIYQLQSHCLQALNSEVKSLSPVVKVGEIRKRNVIYFLSSSYPFCPPLRDATREYRELKLGLAQSPSHQRFSAVYNSPGRGLTRRGDWLSLRRSLAKT